MNDEIRLSSKVLRPAFSAVVMSSRVVSESVRTALALRARLLRRAVMLAVGVGLGFQAQAVDYTDPGYQVGVIRSPDGRPCTFFTLVGVAQADPVVPNSPWFVIGQSAVGYKEMLAMLITAKTTGKPVYVSTTGSVVSACGQAGVYVVTMP